MPFALTNKQFATRAAAWLPLAHKEFADQTTTTAVTNTGLAGLQWGRVMVFFKSFGVIPYGDTYRATLQVGTGAAITGPQNIAQGKITVAAATQDGVIEMFGSSSVGFQSYKVILAADLGGTFTADVMVDLA